LLLTWKTSPVSKLADLAQPRPRELALRQTEPRWRTLFRASPVGIWHFTAGGMASLSRVNQALVRMLGYSREEIARPNIPAIAHVDGSGGLESPGADVA